MQSWFVLKSGTVLGPVNSEKVLSDYNSQNVLVWGLNCDEWLLFKDWSYQLSQGAFNIKPDLGILINPESNEKPEKSKIFKIRPESNMQHDTQQHNDSAETQVYEPEGAPQVNLAPLPLIPNVDDIFSDSDSSADTEEEVSIVLHNQLNNILDQPVVDEEGHTLIQATMEDLTQEPATSDSDDDSATKVQSRDNLGLGQAEQDGSTKIQSLIDVTSETVEESPTEIQTAEDARATDSADPKSATKVQNFENFDLNLEDIEDDGPTKVQSMDDLSLELQSGEATKVQSKALDIDEFDLSSDNLALGQSDQASEDYNLEIDVDSEIKKTASLEEFSLSSDQDLLTESSDEIQQKVQGEKSVRIADKTTDVRSTDLGLNEKTNVAQLKEVAQHIEQKKLLEAPVWFVAYDGESEGPMNVETLFKKLDSFKNPDFVYLWKKGMKDWQNLYDTPQISVQLGIGFRRHERFAYSGTVKIEFNGNTQIGQLENLSLSGIGATGFGPLVLGEVVKVTLDCSELKNDIEFVAQIRFTSESGVLGLSYVKTEYVENVNKLIELVKAQGSLRAA